MAVVRPLLALVVFLAVVMFNFSGDVFIHPQTRHQGVLLAFLVTAYWLGVHAVKAGTDRFALKHVRHVFVAVLYVVWAPILVSNVAYTWAFIVEEAWETKSTALALGHYVRSNKQLDAAIVIGEPDYALQAISYYTNNPIYLVREQRFAKFVTYATTYERDLSLSDLLRAAEELHRKHDRPILIALGYFGIADVEKGAGKWNPLRYRGAFILTHKEIRRFKKETLKLAEFNNAITDENFQLFLYAEPEKLRAYRKKYMELR